MTAKILAIINDKGGTGKTIVSVHMAVAAELTGLATVILDFDPRAMASVWGDNRSIKFPAVVPAQMPRLPRLLEQARANAADLIILDTPGNDLPLAANAAAHADTLLMPARPYAPDLIALAATVKLARESGKPAYVVINAAPSQGVETAEAIAAITKQGVEVCPVVLHQRKPFVSRFHEGLTATDFEPKGKAAAETREFFLWVCEKVLLLPKKKVTELTNKLAIGA